MKPIRVVNGVEYYRGDRVLVEGKYGEEVFPGTISGWGEASNELSIQMDDNEFCTESFPMDRICLCVDEFLRPDFKLLWSKRGVDDHDISFLRWHIVVILVWMVHLVKFVWYRYIRR